MLLTIKDNQIVVVQGCPRRPYQMDPEGTNLFCVPCLSGMFCKNWSSCCSLTELVMKPLVKLGARLPYRPALPAHGQCAVSKRSSAHSCHRLSSSNGTARQYDGNVSQRGGKFGWNWMPCHFEIMPPMTTVCASGVMTTVSAARVSRTGALTPPPMGSVSVGSISESSGVTIIST